MSIKFAQKKGFTIIELLVTVTVMAILLGISLAGYLQFEQKQRVQQTARDVRQVFVDTRRKAQVKDQSGCTGDGVTGYAQVDGYEVQIIPNSNGSVSVISRVDCDPFTGQNPSVTVPSNIIFTPSVDLTLTYSPLTTELTCGGSTCSEKNIVLSEDGTNFGFTISPSGQIGGLAPISEEEMNAILEMAE